MTIAESKTAIAAALTALDGITGHAHRPNVLNEGDAFVRWAGWERADGSAYVATYTVTLILPQGSEEAADARAYAVADLIEDALRPLLYVTSFTPTAVPVEGQPRGLFALTVTGRSE